ncbi:DUF4127 family protein [Spirosoma sp. RP8]|uniref:DUF4127 family protein n=1 Tax=Spirosoma liriopis TaxID=2937440 RepID=A0ABT0HLG3_9BACT|nr:DUF4127 family protein [Spirosoma liriopis]MCK8492978.1 DUF4127 family protein [Spirosoma liriopis]
MPRLLILTVLVLFAGLWLPASAGTAPAFHARILLIPLDDRPPCLQFTQRMGRIGDAEVVTPPMELLGRFTTPGQSEKIINWVQQQDLKSFDAAIIALDMLAYGGLVGSRVHNVSFDEAIKRLTIMAELHKRAPALKIYAQSVVMRLAPTADQKNGAYREKLAHWAEISVATDAKSKTETATLEREIPAEGLADYKRARSRNLRINKQAIDLVRRGVIDYLLLTQDDAKPQGVHIADRETLIAETKRLKLTDKIAIQPGADEVSMLLLARALNKHANFSPRVKAVYSSEKVGNTVMPFEDRPLRQTVSYHINATGSQEVDREQDADVLYYVYASRFEKDRAESFADEIAQKIGSGKHVIVADVDPKGDVQGGDTAFTMALEKRHILPELSGYASWNTAGNTIGTALPQGVIFTLAQAKLLKQPAVAERIWSAQNWFLIHRVLDDYCFHNLIRAKANQFARQVGRSSTLMSDETTRQVEEYSLNLLRQSFDELATNFEQKRPGSYQQVVRCTKPTNLRFNLPWNRTFEALIDFDLSCSVTP